MKLANPVLLALGIALACSTPLSVRAEEGVTAEDAIMSSEGFLSYHPDLRYRLAGLSDYRDGKYTEALADFKRAARFADKPSQGMLGEMLWKGMGTPVDRPAAYIWMDLAAERGYKMMLVKRENFWAEMTAAERQRALEIGDAMYLEYADEFAKPRMEARLRKARMKMTGSRTGFVGSLQIEIPTPNGSRTIDGTTYYQDQFWKPYQYWRMQDGDWKEFGEGRVDIGEIQAVGQPTVPADSPDDEEDPR